MARTFQHSINQILSLSLSMKMKFSSIAQMVLRVVHSKTTRYIRKCIVKVESIMQTTQFTKYKKSLHKKKLDDFVGEIRDRKKETTNFNNNERWNYYFNLDFMNGLRARRFSFLLYCVYVKRMSIWRIISSISKILLR